MLRIISKMAQMATTPGSPTDAYRKPGQFLRNLTRQKGENRRQRAWDRNIQHFDKMRDPANGPCGACGQFLAIDPRTGRKICPGCPFAAPRPTTLRPPSLVNRP